MDLICDHCISFHEERHNCLDAHSPRWGDVSGKDVCSLFISRYKCRTCDYINEFSEGCNNVKSGRYGVVSGQIACVFWAMRRKDKRGGFLTNLEGEENDN